jgi:hypothetical protein
MFGSTILDVAVGLIFTFLTVSLIASALTEAVSSVLGWRSRTLLAGIKDLLNDEQFSNLARKLYEHASINPRGSGDAGAPRDIRSRPSYIDPIQFANALTDIVGMVGTTPAAIKQSYQSAVPDNQIRQLLDGMVDRTGGDLAKVRTELANWFDNAMDRVGGAYKRYAQLFSFIVAFVVAGGLNVDSIQITKFFWLQPIAIKAINVPNEMLPGDAFESLRSLPMPLGWTAPDSSPAGGSIGTWVISIVGWLLTAIATLFGAPFWFDLLQTIIRLKGSGPSPAEKQKSLGAAA